MNNKAKCVALLNNSNGDEMLNFGLYKQNLAGTMSGFR